MEYRLEMPKRAVTVEFKTDMVGCSSFLMLDTWLGMPYQYVKELTIEQDYVGVSPDAEPQIVAYTNASKIAKIKSALCDMPVYQVRMDSELAAEVEGGAYIKYTFRTETESYELFVANRRIVAETTCIWCTASIRYNQNKSNGMRFLRYSV